MIRYPGSKHKLSRKIVEWYSPLDVTGMDYYEPFHGTAYVFRRILLNELPFRSFHLSDKFEWISRYLLALRGDITCLDGSDIADKIDEYRERLLPECEHEEEIREDFERCKALARLGDPFAYLFLTAFCNQQYCHPNRRDTASFHAQFLRRGITHLTREKVLEWRKILVRATVKQADAFEVLSNLDCNAFCYLDPPYVSGIDGSGRQQLYGCEFVRKDHERLAEILKSAPFKWCLSYGDHPLIRELYDQFKPFRWLHRSQKGTRTRFPEQGEFLIRNYERT